jgi:hypothetical protein
MDKQTNFIVVISEPEAVLIRELHTQEMVMVGGGEVTGNAH